MRKKKDFDDDSWIEQKEKNQLFENNFPLRYT